MCSVIGAVGNNGKGVAGINWSVQIMAIRFFGGDQSIGNVHEWTGDVLEAFNYLIQQRGRGVNIRVTNNSYYDWGNQASTLAVSDAINIAGTEGILTGALPETMESRRTVARFGPPTSTRLMSFRLPVPTPTT